MSMPEVSVVMSVYNGAEHLEKTLTSILSQEGCDLEFIVVNDGSTDDTGRILDEWAARDERLRVVHQQNAGLTRALIQGCALAKGEYIARQDVEDISLQGRLRRQADRLREDAGCVAVSCHTDFVGPQGEYLYTVKISGHDLNRTLLSTDPDVLAGPAGHGSVMMRRRVYEAVGGYRSSFYFAQDLDLWTRLIEHGHFSVEPTVLFRVYLAPKSISGMWSKEQRRLKEIIAQASASRRKGEAEDQQLSEAEVVHRHSKDKALRRLSSGYYFIGSCLRRRDPVAASGYFLQATRHDPINWRAWLRLVECKVKGAF
jgi:glycosyltransferase involved in cell wall biosynthesis